MGAFRSGKRLLAAGLVMGVCVVGFAGCDRERATPSLEEQRKTTIRDWVGNFKVGLIDLAGTYPELKGVENVEHGASGFVFLNDRVKPRVRVALKVADTRHSGKQATEPTDDAEILPDVNVACDLELECKERPELAVDVLRRYERFKISLGRDLAWVQSTPPDENRDGLSVSNLISLGWLAAFLALTWSIYRSRRYQADARARLIESMDMQRLGLENGRESLEIARESLELQRQTVQQQQQILDELKKRHP